MYVYVEKYFRTSKICVRREKYVFYVYVEKNIVVSNLKNYHSESHKKVSLYIL